MFFKKNHENNDNLKNENGKHKMIVPKVLSVLAAIILWFYVFDSQATIEEKVITGIPVIFENFDEEFNLDIVSGNEHSIEVKVSGTKQDLLNISKKDIIVTADMNGIEKAGTYSLAINITAPSGIEIVDKSASEVSVKVDKTITKNIEVEVGLLYDKLDDSVYDIGDPILSSSSVQVTGPQSDVEKIAKLSASIDTGEIKTSFKSQSSLVAVDNAGNPINSPYIKFSQSSVTVNIPVFKRTSVPVEVVFENNDDYIYDYKIIPDRVYIKGEVSVVDSVRSIKTFKVDSTEKMKVVKKLDLPEGVSAFNFDGTPINDVEIAIIDVTPVSVEPVQQPEETDNAE